MSSMQRRAFRTFRRTLLLGQVPGGGLPRATQSCRCPCGGGRVSHARASKDLVEESPPLPIRAVGRTTALSPLRYPGGKAALTGFFADVIARLGLRDVRYVEPYAGG